MEILVIDLLPLKIALHSLRNDEQLETHQLQKHVELLALLLPMLDGCWGFVLQEHCYA